MLETFRTGDLVMDEELDRIQVILGNGLTEDGELWCADWETLQTRYTDIGNLNHQTEVTRPEWVELVSKMEAVAEAGDSDAMWWCAWAYAGVNHQKSVWYYMAAMRRAPKQHGWAWSRVFSDARSAYMCKGVPKPNLSFLMEIEEFQGSGKWGDWKKAIEAAGKAIHVAI